MKVELHEIHFLKESMKSIQIKASDAPSVGRLIEKMDKEFLRLQKIEESKIQ